MIQYLHRLPAPDKPKSVARRWGKATLKLVAGALLAFVSLTVPYFKESLCASYITSKPLSEQNKTLNPGRTAPAALALSNMTSPTTGQS